jgi:hypothetical protein
MAESLTDAVIAALQTAYLFVRTFRSSSRPPAPLLRYTLNSLGGLVSNSNLYKPADEFRGLYPMPPEPIGGVRAKTWHDLGRDLAVGIVDNIIGTAMYAEGVLCEVIYDRSMSNEQIDAILRQWPAVQAYLRDEAPRFDCRQLVAMIED